MSSLQIRRDMHSATEADKFEFELSRVRKVVECMVTDNGSAPANVRRGRGLTIVDELVKGLDGCLNQKFGYTGSVSVLTFPYIGEPQRRRGPEERDCAGVAKATT